MKYFLRLIIWNTPDRKITSVWTIVVVITMLLICAFSFKLW